MTSEDDAGPEKQAEQTEEAKERSPSLEPPNKEDIGQGDVGEEAMDAMAAMSISNTDGVPKELLVKHPLQYRWVLWYCKQDRNKKWEDCLKEVASFDTVEDFWA